jgi:hypothetical protein
VLEPLEGGRTRLICRDRVRYAPLDLSVPFWPFFFVADLIAQPTMLHGIKRPVEQVEALDASRWGWSSPRPGPEQGRTEPSSPQAQASPGARTL